MSRSSGPQTLEALIGSLGGALDEARLPKLVLEELDDFFEVAEDEMQFLADSDPPRPIHFCWIQSPTFGAFAGRINDVDTIAVPYGTPLVLRELFYAVATNAALSTAEDPVPAPGTTLPNHLGYRTLLGVGGRYFLEPETHDLATGRLLSYVGFLFLLYHEAAHLFRSHLDEPDVESLFFEESAQQGGAHRMLEIDADWVGLATLLNNPLTDHFKGATSDFDLRHTAEIFVWVPMLVLALLDRRETPRDESSDHPLPLSRLQILLTVARNVLAWRDEFDDDAANSIVNGAARQLGAMTRFLGIEERAWTNPKREDWDEDAVRAELDAYYRWRFERYEEPAGLDSRPARMVGD